MASELCSRGLSCEGDTDAPTLRRAIHISSGVGQALTYTYIRPVDLESYHRVEETKYFGQIIQGDRASAWRGHQSQRVRAIVLGNAHTYTCLVWARPRALFYEARARCLPTPRLLKFISSLSPRRCGTGGAPSRREAPMPVLFMRGVHAVYGPKEPRGVERVVNHSPTGLNRPREWEALGSAFVVQRLGKCVGTRPVNM
eukprot:2140554-Pleurochrysis_carterae.AAC.1